MSDGISFQVAGLSWFPFIVFDFDIFDEECSWAGIEAFFIGVFGSDLFKDPVNGCRAYRVQFLSDMAF